MSKVIRGALTLAIVVLITLFSPAAARAHAALERSDPPAGSVVDRPPERVTLWFTEPLERAYTGADLLDASGVAVSGVAAAIAPENPYALIMTLPSDLGPGSYTVAWRTLSTADGHTLQGYFGFRVGPGPAAALEMEQPGSTVSDSARELSRGLALIGLAMLLAIAPVTLGVLDLAALGAPALGGKLQAYLRRFSLLAVTVALLGSIAALMTQAAAIAPGDAPVTAIARTLTDTRYGRLWLVRLGLVVGCSLLIGAAFWGSERRRDPLLFMASIVALLMPIPFSLLSHAAALDEGRVAAVTTDVLHLLAASLWAGGLFMLALILPPILWRLPPDQRVAALNAALPRFSALAVAAWGVLLLTGLYSSWLQVGTTAALRETLYGRALLLKGALLLPVLGLAAFHLLLGRRGVRLGDPPRIARTLVGEALIVVAVMVVVGRLIGLEPAREAMATRLPSALQVHVSFATNEGERGGELTITPGAAGVNAFALAVAGAPLPEGTEALLRFALPEREIGEQELRLPTNGPNQFAAESDDLALAGDWRLTIIVRRIGSFTWHSQATVPVGIDPPPSPEPNPAPRFADSALAAMIAIALGISVIALTGLSRSVSPRHRGTGVGVGSALLIAGSLVLAGSRLPPEGSTVPREIVAHALATPAPASSGSPAAMESHAGHLSRATPAPEAAAMPGTPVATDGLLVSLAVSAEESGPVDVAVTVTDESGGPVSGARVNVLSEMEGMSAGSEETAAIETDPGIYLARDVPLSMPGEWRLTVRVSPKAQPTRIVPFVVAVR